MAEFVPLFAHPRLTADAYGKAVSRYFHAGIQVPIVIIADPSGREIPGTRLDDRTAQVKATYLDHAKKALDAFRGGLSASKSKEQWVAFGKARALRTEGKDSGAGIDALRKVLEGAPKGSMLRAAVEEQLKVIDEEEAAGKVAVGKMDLEGDDPEAGLEMLFLVVRDFPGLPSAAKAEALLETAKADPARKEAFAAAERGHRAWIALRAADRLARDGKEKEAAEARAAVVKEFPGTAAAEEAGERK